MIRREYFLTVPPSHSSYVSFADTQAWMLVKPGSIFKQWIDFALFWAGSSSAQWRVPIALQIVFALIMIGTIGFVSAIYRYTSLRAHDSIVA